MVADAPRLWIGFLTVAGTVIAVVGGVGLVITKAISAFKILKAGFLLAKGALVLWTLSRCGCVAAGGRTAPVRSPG